MQIKICSQVGELSVHDMNDFLFLPRVFSGWQWNHSTESARGPTIVAIGVERDILRVGCLPFLFHYFTFNTSVTNFGLSD